MLEALRQSTAEGQRMERASDIQSLCLQRLHYARQHFSQLRWRTSRTVAMLGWALMLLGWLPVCCQASLLLIASDCF